MSNLIQQSRGSQSMDGKETNQQEWHSEYDHDDVAEYPKRRSSSRRGGATRSSTIEKAEYLVRQLFGSCSTNVSNFSDMFKESMDLDDIKGRGSSSTAETEQSYSDSSRQKERRRSKSLSNSKRRQRSMSRRRRSGSRNRNGGLDRSFATPNRPFGRHAEISVVPDNDDVSAISARTLEEMASRQQRVKMYNEAKKAGIIRLSAHTEQNGDDENDQENIPPSNGEDDQTRISQMSSNTTEFESIWKSNVEESSPIVGIYEEAEKEAHANLEDLKPNECSTPLARKLKRYQINTSHWQKEHLESVDTALLPNEQEI